MHANLFVTFLVKALTDLPCHGHWKISILPQPAITCSKLTIGTLEQSVKYAQS